MAAELLIGTVLKLRWRLVITLLPLTPRCYSDLGGAPAITDADVEGLPARYENRGKARNVNRGEK